jgi:L-ascorbate metabolism protein UlaG (beta-lactamase superfamily)
VPDVRITHIGGSTTLIEIDGFRLLTDPTFDAPRRYTFGWGFASRKTTGPAVAVADLPSIDAVLLTHDHHGDNLDDAGRALLPSAGSVLTTAAGARRLGGNAVGLAPWQTFSLPHGIEVTATPARHGPR